MLGPSLSKAINDGVRDYDLDLSELAVPDMQTMEQFNHMSRGEIQAEISRLESEAAKLTK